MDNIYDLLAAIAATTVIFNVNDEELITPEIFSEWEDEIKTKLKL